MHLYKWTAKVLRNLIWEGLGSIDVNSEVSVWMSVLGNSVILKEDQVTVKTHYTVSKFFSLLVAKVIYGLWLHLSSPQKIEKYADNLGNSLYTARTTYVTIW